MKARVIGPGLRIRRAGSSWPGLSRPPRSFLFGTLKLGVAGTRPATRSGHVSRNDRKPALVLVFAVIVVVFVDVMSVDGDATGGTAADQLAYGRAALSVCEIHIRCRDRAGTGVRLRDED